MVESTLIILALMGFWISFICGRQVGQGLEKLQHVTKCVSCLNFWQIEPVWRNKNLLWNLTWLPEKQSWVVEISDPNDGSLNDPCGNGQSQSITEACKAALKDHKGKRG